MTQFNSSSLIRLLVWVGCIGGLISFAIFIITAFADNLFWMPFCFKDSCFQYLFNSTKTALDSFRLTVSLLALIGTVGVFLVALMSYRANSDTARFTNHIAYLKLFQDYLSGEVQKRDSLSLSSFDAQRLYSFIFNGSRDGVMDVSADFKEFIAGLNREINKSNLMASNAQDGSFRYLEHQARMKNLFAKVGFNLPLQPKKEFYEIESDLLLLLKNMNDSFCLLGEEGTIAKRTYR